MVCGGGWCVVGGGWCVVCATWCMVCGMWVGGWWVVGAQCDVPRVDELPVVDGVIATVGRVDRIDFGCGAPRVCVFGMVSGSGRVGSGRPVDWVCGRAGVGLRVVCVQGCAAKIATGGCGGGDAWQGCMKLRF